MSTPTLHKKILDVLSDSSSQKPVTFTSIQALIYPKFTVAELTTEIQSMCISRELQTCNGIKNGEEYVCFWVSGNLPPAWGKPSKMKPVAKKPEATHS